MRLLAPGAERIRFPPVDEATPEGLLAVGGDLSTARLLAAYRQGIFPWYSAGQPILWWSPDPRAILRPEGVRITRSLAKTLRHRKYEVTMDTAFRRVLAGCAAPRRPIRDPGTWITAEMVEAYCRLHDEGWAHSVEVWYDGQLAGGLYGVALGGAFFGESMFSRVSDASKVGLAWLARQLERWNFAFIDCQLPSPHMFSLGAVPLGRSRFIADLQAALQISDRRGHWRLDPDLTLP